MGPYKTFDDQIIEVAGNTWQITQFLELDSEQTDIENQLDYYIPSYTYQYDVNTFEIGIAGDNLEMVFETIKLIQKKLLVHNCLIDENLEKIDIMEYE